MNLKKETLEMLFAHGKSVNDILWVGSRDGEIKIELDDFLKVSDNEYDAGYGSNEVNSDLVIVGKDWWLTRWEYDGSEGWSFQTIPTLVKNYKIGTNVFVKDFDDEWGIIDNLTLVEREAQKRNLA